MSTIASGYLRPIFDLQEYPNVIERITRALHNVQKGRPFEAIAFTGVSGASVAFTVSYLTKIPLLLVRKENDSSHSSRPVEGHVEVNSYVVLDDFISSGDTVRRIIKEIERRHPQARCVAVIIWNSSDNGKIQVDGYPEGIPLIAANKYAKLE